MEAVFNSSLSEATLVFILMLLSENHINTYIKMVLCILLYELQYIIFLEMLNRKKKFLLYINGIISQKVFQATPGKIHTRNKLALFHNPD